MTSGADRWGPVARRAVGVSLAASAVVLGALAVLPAGWHARPTAVVAVAACFGLVGMAPLRIELAEQRVEWLLSEAVLVVAMVHLTPRWVVVAAAAGQLLCGAAARQSPLKALVNVTGAAAAAAVASAVFTLRPAGLGPLTWAVALGAVGASSFADALAVTAVVARAEGSRTGRLLRASLPLSVPTSVLAGTVGLVVVLLLRTSLFAPLALVPLAACVAVNARSAARQRDEHQRVQRLYDATDRTTALVGRAETPSALAGEARLLCTGAAGFVVATDGIRSAAATDRAWPEAVDASGVDLAGMLDQAAAHPLPAAIALPDGLAHLAPGADTLLVARAPDGSGVDLVVAVARSGPGSPGLGATLQAFAAHAAVVMATTWALDGLRAALDAQVRANRRKDEFVAAISHELRTPLTVMIGSAETLQRAADRLDAASRATLVDSTVRQGERLRRLIDDLLLVAAGTGGQSSCSVEALSVPTVLADALDDVPDGRRGRVATFDRSGGATVLADRGRVRQVLANLVGNAAKYAPDSPVTVDARCDGDVVVLSVVDHGPGIGPADRERAFELFVQLDQSSTRRQGGAGIGLHLSRELAVQMGGSLELVDTPGGGCTFELRLPALSVPAGEVVAA